MEDTVKRLDLLGHYPDLVAWEQTLATNQEHWRHRCVLVNESSWKTSEIIDQFSKFWQLLKTLPQSIPDAYPDGYLDRVIWAMDAKVYPVEKALKALQELEPKLRRNGTVTLFPGTSFLNGLRELLRDSGETFSSQEIVNVLGELLPKYDTVRLDSTSAVLEFSVGAREPLWPTPGSASSFSPELIDKIQRETSKIDWELANRSPLAVQRRLTECPFDHLLGPILILEDSTLAKELGSGNKREFDDLRRNLFGVVATPKCPEAFKSNKGTSARDYLLELWKRLELRDLTKVRRETAVTQSLEDYLKSPPETEKQTESLVVLDLDLNNELPNCITDLIGYIQRREIAKTDRFTMNSLSITETRCLVVSVARDLVPGRPELRLSTRIEISPYIQGPANGVYSLNLILARDRAYFKHSDNWYLYGDSSPTVKRVRWNDVLEDAATNCELLVWDK